MSEPTYRIIMTHDPAESEYDEGVSEYDREPPILSTFGATREAAFDRAQAWCKAKASEPEAPSTVFLTEDGELFDRHEVRT